MLGQRDDRSLFRCFDGASSFLSVLASSLWQMLTLMTQIKLLCWTDYVFRHPQTPSRLCGWYFKTWFHAAKKKQLIYLFHGRGHLYLLFTHPIKDEWRVLSLWTKPCQSLEQREWGNGHINRTSLNCCISLKFPGIWANELIWNGGTRTGRGVKSQRARLHVFPHISPSLTLMAELQRDWTVPVNPSVLQSGH